MMQSRRQRPVRYLVALFGGIICLAFGLSDRRTHPPDVFRGDITRVYSGEHVIGDSIAPVTVIAYVNFTCPYCAVFHKEVFPRLINEFVATGKIRLVYRVFPASNDISGYPILAAEVAECTPSTAFWSMTSLLYRDQGQSVWENFRQWSAEAGLDSSALDGCLGFHKQREMVMNLQHRFGSHRINATPTLFIGDNRIEGLQRFDTYAAMIRTALRKI